MGFFERLKYDKSFAVALCGTAHDALDGKSFKNYREWYNHLKGLSSEVKIQKSQDCYIATNLEREM